MLNEILCWNIPHARASWPFRQASLLLVAACTFQHVVVKLFGLVHRYCCPICETTAQHNGPAEQPTTARHDQMHTGGRCTRRPAHDCDPLDVSSESLDVPVDPLQRLLLIEGAIIAGAVLWTSAKPFTAKETENAEAVIDGDHDCMTGDHELLHILCMRVAACTHRVATAVEPNDDRADESALRIKGVRGVDVKVQAILVHVLINTGTHASRPEGLRVQYARAPWLRFARPLKPTRPSIWDAQELPAIFRVHKPKNSTDRQINHVVRDRHRAHSQRFWWRGSLLDTRWRQQ
mmetsp:Transcript_54746/g.152790  ORF Transcript_54746/g.152790 Transcript_54746/m.152790 type:complete len:291 (-) Transcript_54746:164-1036(-)